MNSMSPKSMYIGAVYTIRFSGQSSTTSIHTVCNHLRIHNKGCRALILVKHCVSLFSDKTFSWILNSKAVIAEILSRCTTDVATNTTALPDSVLAVPMHTCALPENDRHLSLSLHILQTGSQDFHRAWKQMCLVFCTECAIQASGEKFLYILEPQCEGAESLAIISPTKLKQNNREIYKCQLTSKSHRILKPHRGCFLKRVSQSAHGWLHSAMNSWMDGLKYWWRKWATQLSTTCSTTMVNKSKRNLSDCISNQLNVSQIVENK